MTRLSRTAGAAIMVFLLSTVLTIAAMGCSGAPKVKFERTQVIDKRVVGVGYGWGENAEADAKKAAVDEAIALALPRAVEFTYLKVDRYEMFKTQKNDYTETKVLSTEKLEDGGVKVTVEAFRTKEAVKAMRFMHAAHFQIKCKADTFKQRVEMCNGKIYSRALMEFATKNFKDVPDKMIGNFSFFSINREDNGRSKMLADVVVFVGSGKGKLTKQEKAMVLMNAWRSQCSMGKGAEAAAIYRQAIKAHPSAAFAEEFGLFEMGEERVANAIEAFQTASKFNPHEIKYYKILYKLYEKSGNEEKKEAVVKHLKELEAWDENVGADISGSLQYKTKVKWTDTDGHEEKEGKVHFFDSGTGED